MNSSEVVFPIKEGRLNGYFITKDGKIFSNRGPVEMKRIKTTINNRGYEIAVITVKNVSINISVHRLMALTFLENPENKPQINHKDGNKLNNTIENLEWVTNSENLKHAFRNGLNKSPMKNPETAKKVSLKLKGRYTLGESRTARKVIDTKTGKVYGCIKEVADLFGFNYSHFAEQLKGRVTNTTSFIYYNQ